MGCEVHGTLCSSDNNKTVPGFHDVVLGGGGGESSNQQQKRSSVTTVHK